MRNKVRFFKAIDARADREFSNATIPQIGAAVFLDGEIHRIVDITYEYGHESDPEQHILVDVFVEKEDMDEF